MLKFGNRDGVYRLPFRDLECVQVVARQGGPGGPEVFKMTLEQAGMQEIGA